MSIKETLSVPAPTQYHLHQAVRHITYAMQGRVGAPHVRLALAQVRAHRQEMRDQGRRAPDYRDDFIVPSADLLYTAARHILTESRAQAPAFRRGVSEGCHGRLAACQRR